MDCYRRNRQRVDDVLRKSRVVVVMNKAHVEKPEHMVTTMKCVYEAGYVAEVTFRIPAEILRDAMAELRSVRAAAPADRPFILGVGSVINPRELDAALDMGFDMIVAPANVMGGCGPGIEFVRRCHAANVFCAPAILSPTELNYFLERDDGLEPDCLKVFPAGVYGPKGVADLLAPFERTRHRGKMIMPTGAVNYETGPEYLKAIASRGFTPVLGMSAPLELVVQRKKPGDPDTIRESLDTFRATFTG